MNTRLNLGVNTFRFSIFNASFRCLFKSLRLIISHPLLLGCMPLSESSEHKPKTHVFIYRETSWIMINITSLYSMFVIFQQCNSDFGSIWHLCWVHKCLSDQIESIIFLLIRCKVIVKVYDQIIKWEWQKSDTVIEFFVFSKTDQFLEEELHSLWDVINRKCMLSHVVFDIF